MLGMRNTMYQAGTLERLVLSERILVTYVPLPATSSESVPGDIYARMPLSQCKWYLQPMSLLYLARPVMIHGAGCCLKE